MIGSRPRAWILAAVLAGAGLLGGCAGAWDAPSYYWQSAWGQFDLWRSAQPVQGLLKDTALDARLRERLELAVRIRRFASRELGLPDNGSYTRYSELARPYVVWTVQAAPEFSLEPLRWCFPVAGCVGYRGYFRRDQALEQAARLRARGYDVQVSGVAAYSTLGWFDDPLLSSFIAYPEADLAGLIFHELAHQVVYVKGDTRFNESFASAVEEAGVARWLAAGAGTEGRARADPGGDMGTGAGTIEGSHGPEAPDRADSALVRWQARRERREAFTRALLATRERLAALYASGQSEPQLCEGKREAFEALRREHERLRASWGGASEFQRWFDQDLGNAHLAAVGMYTDGLPAFRAMLAEQQGDLPRFYAAVRDLAARDSATRDAVLAGAPALR